MSVEPSLSRPEWWRGSLAARANRRGFESLAKRNRCEASNLCQDFTFSIDIIIGGYIQMR